MDSRTGRYDDPTPFGDYGTGPSADLFKPATERYGRNGLSNIRKRSYSGADLPIPPSAVSIVLLLSLQRMAILP